MSKSHTFSAYDVRSKNAGPFWLTIDIFCDDTQAYQQLCAHRLLTPDSISQMFRANPEGIRIFRIDALNVVKVSLPRPVIQGSLEDRDLHGAQWSCLLQEALDQA